jgi:hypothetical protein
LHAVNDLIHAAKEASSVLHRVSEYLQETEEHFKNEALFKYPPSKEEIDLMVERWDKFSKSMESLDRKLYASISAEISSSPCLTEARYNGKIWRDIVGESTSTSAQPNAPTKQWKVILNTNAPDKESAPPLEPKPSFFRALLQQILSCIFFK